MEIVRELAGFSLGGADMVRRAMSKKKAKDMEKARKNFIYGEEDETGNVIIPGCLRRGIDEKIATSIFDDMDAFAKYAFNKSHAAAYAVVAYQTAYLKCFYPVFFMAALISGFMDETEKVSLYVEKCRAMGINILPPDINKSYSTFSVEGDSNIRFGLGTVKNVGIAFMDRVVKEREEKGEFKSFTDFAKRMSGKDINKRAVEGIIRVGAFDNIVPERNRLLAAYEGILESAMSEKRSNIEGQINLFGDLFGINEEVKDDLPSAPPLPKSMILDMEKEFAGMYFSGHPLDEYRGAVDKSIYTRIAELYKSEEEMEYSDGDNVTLAGIITSRRDKITKNNTLMSFIVLEDFTGSIEIIVFPKTLTKLDSILKEGEIVRVAGRLDIKEDNPAKLIMDTSAPIEKEEAASTGGVLKIRLNDGEEKHLDDVRRILLSVRGNDRVKLVFSHREIEAHASVMTNKEKVKTLINQYFGEERCE